MLEQGRVHSYQQAWNKESGALYFTQGTPLMLMTEESVPCVFMGSDLWIKARRR